MNKVLEDKFLKNFVVEELKKLGLEEFNKDDPLFEDSLINITTDTSDIKPQQLSKKVIPVVFAKAFITNFFDLVNMDRPTFAKPKYSHNLESTTAYVTENGQIKTSKISSSTVTMTAIKYAIRSKMTTEAIEDAAKYGWDYLQKLQVYDVKAIVDELDEYAFNLMKTGAAAGDVWWDINIPSDYASDHPAREYDESLYDAIMAATEYVAEQKYSADFMVFHPNELPRLSKLNHFVPSEPETSMQGEMGRIFNLAAFSSLNSLRGMILLGEKRTFGVYGSYIPMQYRKGAYDDEYDTESWNVRTRVAMMITEGEALARVILYDNYTDEEVTISEGAGNTKYYPINDAETLTVKDGDNSTVLTVTTWDSRTEEAPVITTGNTISLDLETGAIDCGSTYSPTDSKVIFTAYSARAV